MTPPMMPGSAIVPPLVRQRLPDLSGTAAKLAIALSGYVNAKTGDAFPSNKRLMRDAGILDWKTFRHARKELAGCGLTWKAGKGKALTTYRWNGVSGKNGESGILGVSKVGKIGDSNFAPQVTDQLREQPTSRETSRAGAKAKRAASTKTPGPNVVKWWADAGTGAGRKTTITAKVAGQCGNLGRLVSGGEMTPTELQESMALYFKDADPFLAKAGYPIGLFVDRLDKYRNGPGPGRRGSQRHPVRGLIEAGAPGEYSGVGKEIRND